MSYRLTSLLALVAFLAIIHLKIEGLSLKETHPLKVLSVIGTRPEAIKMAPVVRELKRHPDKIASVVCVTAQHREMLDQALKPFNIQSNYDLNIMQPGQTPVQVMSRIMEQIEPLFVTEQPDWVLVQGDTTTVLATAMVAFHRQVRIGHVEAGLRTHDLRQPFPEEMNRTVVDLMSDLCFAPTFHARENLLAEGVDETRIRVTGNTIIDALQDISSRPYDWSQSPLSALPSDRPWITVTTHRRENLGRPLENICLALRDIAECQPDHHIIHVVHPNPTVVETTSRLLTGISNLSLISPLNYDDLIQLVKRSRLVLTDSGGLQEEAPSLGVPVLVLRDTTERPEAVDAGVAYLVGADRDRIFTVTTCLLNDTDMYERMARATNPFGDGHAAQRIVQALLESTP